MTAKALKKASGNDSGHESAGLKVQRLSIDSIKPYWRNPRRIGEPAIQAVRRSIEAYGFLQPIVIDRNHVIIAGHARYQALRRLERSEADCIVADLDEEQARQYRIMDNKSGELSDWDEDALIAEMRALSDIEALAPAFDEGEIEKLIAASVGADDPPVFAAPGEHEDRAPGDARGASSWTPEGRITDESIAARTEVMNERFAGQTRTGNARRHLLTCPACGHDFQIDQLQD